MKLKIKFLKWSAGLPVAMLNQKTAEAVGVHEKDRVFIKTISKKPRQLSTIIDTVEKLVKKNEIGVSSEIKEILKLKSGQAVEVSLSPTPKSLTYIRKKLDKQHLTENEINEIIKDIVTNSLSEAEIALFISAMYEQGTTMKETIYLIKAIIKHGKTLKLRGKPVADKHSIGGIAGNRTTPIVVSICAAAGIIMPKTSSRAITTPAGTADVIETIARVDFSIPELKKIIKKTNACLVWGGSSLGIVPADSKIIRIEKMLGIDPEAQLLASIMSKKLAIGSKYIIIDIPYGKSAKVNKERALNLKKKFEYLGRYFNKKIKVVLSDGSQPMGSGVGPILEMIDVLKVLNPKFKGPADLEKKSLFLAGQLLEMTRKAKKGQGISMAEKILNSGTAFGKFKEIIRAQEGSIKNLKPGKFKKDILAKKHGAVKEIDNKKINFLARVAGCPEDKSAGLYIYRDLGDKMSKGEKILTIYSESEMRLKEAIKFFNKSKPITIG